jgi:hypothetical protein
LRLRSHDEVIPIFTVQVTHAHKRKKGQILIFGLYTGDVTMEQNLHIVDTKNTRSKYKVIGIEELEFVDKSKEKLNPWIVVADAGFDQENCIGKSYESKIEL